MKINHVTIQCTDLDRSIAFYENIAGLSMVGDMRGKGPNDIVFLANGEGETCIELIHNPDAAYSGSGISIGFGCDDVQAYHEKLTAAGYETTPIITPNPHVKFFFVKDPDGLQVQFI